MKAQEIVNTLVSLKTKSQGVNTRAQAITLNSGAQITSGGGPYPQVIAGFHEIMSVMTNLTDDIPGSDQISGKDADKVAEAFREFVRTHQVLLHLLTGKGALMKATPQVGEEMKSVLRSERDIVESVGNVLSEAIPSKQPEFKAQQTALKQTITAAIRAH